MSNLITDPNYGDSFYSESMPYPAALHNFMKIQDVSDKAEVKELLNITERALTKYDDIKKQVDTLRGKSNEDWLRSGDIKRFLEIRLKTNNFRLDRLRRDEIRESGIFSIAGGYARNILIGANAKTDVDVIANYDMASLDVLSMFFKRLPSESGVPTFEILDNTIHVIHEPYEVSELENGQLLFNGLTTGYDDERLVNKKYNHMFVNPTSFDFTINCACISSQDGWLYAPPSTLHDIKHKIIRPTATLNGVEDVSSLLRISMVIRAIRFALKYDMTLHDTMYKAIKALFLLQQDRKNIDDRQNYHAIKHLLDDPKELREDIFSTLKRLGMFETDRFSNFSDYFDHIDYCFKNRGMDSKIRSMSERSISY